MKYLKESGQRIGLRHYRKSAHFFQNHTINETMLRSQPYLRIFQNFCLLLCKWSVMAHFSPSLDVILDIVLTAMVGFGLFFSIQSGG